MGTRLEVALGDYPPLGEPFTAIIASDRQSIVDLLSAVKARYGENGFIDISMPCGFSKVFTECSDIPADDLPCPCGHEGRYLIGYEKEEGNGHWE